MAYPLNSREKRSVFYHAGGWIIFIVYELSFLYLIGALQTGINIWGNYVIPYLINIGLFYFHALVALNVAFGGKRKLYLVFTLLVLAEIALYLLLMFLDNWLFTSRQESFTTYLFHQGSQLYIRQLWRGLYFLIFSTGLWFILRYFQNQKKLLEAETSSILQQQENQKTELRLMSTQNAFLQSQINPHLLFNTLNFIHNEVQKASPRAADAIITLSEMMRYSLTETKADGKVLLKSEVSQIENLIRINEFRFDNKLHLRLITDKEQYEGKRIIPLVLIPFVENIFKYAELTDKNAPAEVEIRTIGNTLYFETRNKKRTLINFHSQKIGIGNVRKRLNAHYPGNFSLDISENTESFTVTLAINL